MVTLEESVTDFIRAVVEATRNSDDFLCVVNKKSTLNSKAPGDSAPPELNLFDVFKTLDQRPLKEQGFLKIVSKTTGVAGIAAKLSDKRSNSGRCCYYRNNDSSPPTSHKVYGTHYTQMRIISTTTQAGFDRVKTALDAKFDAAKVLQAMDQLNLMDRRFRPCPKPSRHRCAAVQGTAANAGPSTPTPSLGGPFISNDCAYLSCITKEQMESLRAGNPTNVERPFDEHWKARTNVLSPEGKPKSASVMILSPGDTSEVSEEYSVTRCIVMGGNLRFTLDPSVTLQAPKGSESAAHGNPTPCHETVAMMVRDGHCILETVSSLAENMTLEQAATQKGALSDINSLLVTCPPPAPRTTAPAVCDALQKVALACADDPKLLGCHRTLVDVVDQGKSSQDYRRSKIIVQMADMIKKDRSNRNSTVVDVTSPERRPKRQRVESKENEELPSNTPRSPLATLSTNHLSENSQ
eukprot:CAMPEP_0185748128 /NCGR_PEP_ID=MMETSP1174-20130828/6791_1 /TAXON_ID=35687 /ORGANISM="Dictyocha speculum, Strain CCMP1381" /LENGTH=465 /DNA_ID=CAMNT_0028423641 /DNA_START=269 /DNA_END=1666 /DNA_ORIENTATION=-